MNICFVLPGFSRHPSGGYKMVFEYANRLVNENCNVTILFLNDESFSRYHIPRIAKRALSNLFTQLEPRWFHLDARIKKVSNLEKNYKDKIGRDLDAVFATSAEKTVKEVNENLLAKKKFYFIQDYENWHVSNDFVDKTFKLGFNNIVISKWLKDKVDKISCKESTLIPNAIDTDIYKEYKKITDRRQHTIALLYHEEKHKGLANAFKVLKIVKEKYPDLKVEMFGQFNRPNVPDWIKYYKNANTKQTVKIYNNCQVFLCSTIEEGFGLTGLEAMSCGACLVSTDYKGVHEYGIDDFNSLLSPVGDIQKQVNNVIRVFEDVKLQKYISNNGKKTAQNYSWDSAMDKFNKELNYKYRD